MKTKTAAIVVLVIILGFGGIYWMRPLSPVSAILVFVVSLALAILIVLGLSKLLGWGSKK